MKNFKLEIKEASMIEFLDKYLTKGEERLVPHAHLRDEILVKQNDLKVGDVIKIELSDVSEKRGTELINTYIYEVKAYDDILHLLELQDFDVKVKNK